MKKYFNRLKKSPLRKKIGLLLLLPAIWSVMSFSLITVFGVSLNQYDNSAYASPFIESRVQMKSFGSSWRGTVDYYNEGGGGYTSALPIYIGLMALAGAYLIKD